MAPHSRRSWRLRLIVLAPVLYGFVYPQPYLGQVLRGIPIAVVDQDGTELCRELVQTLNADEAVRVAVRSNTLAEAQAALARREVFAILGIPKDMEREVLRGNKARLAGYVDSAYFLLYNRAWQGITEASAAVSGEIAARGARSNGSLAHAALIRSSPVELVTEPLCRSDGRLCELYRSRRLRADPAADAPHGLGDPRRRRVRAGRGYGPAATRRRARDRRSVARASFRRDPGVVLYLIILRAFTASRPSGVHSIFS